MELHQMIAKLALSVIEAKDKALEWERKAHDREINALLDKFGEVRDELDITEKQQRQDQELIEKLTRDVEVLRSANTALMNDKEALIKDRNFVMDQLDEQRAQFKHLAERYEIKDRDLEAAEVTIQHQIRENSDLEDANEKLKAETRIDEWERKVEGLVNEHCEFKNQLAQRLIPVYQLIDAMEEVAKDNGSELDIKYWLKKLRPIDRAKFIKDTGRADEDDDLERCNCIMAGLPGHESCKFGEYLSFMKGE